MKKISRSLVFLLVLSLLTTTFAACENDKNETPEETTDQGTLDLESGQVIFDTLNAINMLSDAMADSVYNAWHFYIYEFEKYDLNSDDIIQDFAVAVKLTPSEINAGIDQYLELLGTNAPTEGFRRAVLGTNSGAIRVVLLSYDYKGIIDQMNSGFDSSKNLLKKMNSDNEKNTAYSELKEYYSHTLTFFEYVNAPSGNISQFSSAIENYKAKSAEFQSKLSFIYEK